MNLKHICKIKISILWNKKQPIKELSSILWLVVFYCYAANHQTLSTTRIYLLLIFPLYALDSISCFFCSLFLFIWDNFSLHCGSFFRCFKINPFLLLCTCPALTSFIYTLSFLKSLQWVNQSILHFFNGFIPFSRAKKDARLW